MQEKTKELLENYIRPMVKKLLKEEEVDDWARPRIIPADRNFGKIVSVDTGHYMTLKQGNLLMKMSYKQYELLQKSG